MKLVSALGTKLGAQAGALRVVALAALASCLDHTPDCIILEKEKKFPQFWHTPKSKIKNFNFSV